MNKSIKRKKNTIKKNNMYTLKSLKKKNNKKSLLKKKHFIHKGGSDFILSINKINYTPKQKHYDFLNALDILMGNLLINKMTDEGDLCKDSKLNFTNNSECNLHLDISNILKYQDILNDLKKIINALNDGSSDPSKEICSINFDESEIYLSNEEISKFMYGNNKLSENTSENTYYFEIQKDMKNNSFYNIITSNILNTFYNVAKERSYLNNVIKTINESKCIDKKTPDKWNLSPYNTTATSSSPVVTSSNLIPTNSQSNETFGEFLKQFDLDYADVFEPLTTNFSKWFKTDKYEQAIKPIINKNENIVKGHFFVRLDDLSYYDMLKADVDNQNQEITFHLYYITETSQVKSLESIQFFYQNRYFEFNLNGYGQLTETLIELIIDIENKLSDDNEIDYFNYRGFPDSLY